MVGKRRVGTGRWDVWWQALWWRKGVVNMLGFRSTYWGLDTQGEIFGNRMKFELGEVGVLNLSLECMWSAWEETGHTGEAKGRFD